MRTITTLPPLHGGHGTYAGALSLFPISVDGPFASGFNWKAADLGVQEREGSPVVDELVIRNRGRRPLVALEGDLLAGGWQDRMLAASTLLAPDEARVAGVCCIEHGRWSGSGGHGGRGRRGTPSVRFGNAPGVHQGDPQHAVWQRIGRYEHELGTTRTSSMLDHLDRTDGCERSTFHRLAGQRGVVIGVGGRVIGAELYGSPTGLAARWTGTIDAALLDARLAPPAATKAATARAFVRAMGAMALEDGGEAGLGRAVASRRGSLVATGLGVGHLSASPFEVDATIDRVIQLSVFDAAHPLMEGVFA